MGSYLSYNQKLATNSFCKTDYIVLKIKNSNVDKIKQFLDKYPNSIYAKFTYITDEINGKIVNKYTLIDYVIQFEGIMVLVVLCSVG